MSFEIRPFAVGDPEVEPLLAELAHEYETRYGRNTEMASQPASVFAPPDGALLILLEDGVSVAGGAFKRYDERTAELKRVWTHSAHRRRGLARRVVAELEAEAKQRGYLRILLTTGPKQPEAAGLYLATGYRRLPAGTLDPNAFGVLAFEKDL
ncbi:GNAT family N-acetyltransferase [Amycolatopsis sp. H20-H5]|uniref:GNAT family N-acetyltransferase n=1 Tax=Amycolatopsis sp. H20-H5 TaxID=3046309 RepID=UPI002DBF13DC|nr:GNAT family N-acetyltransferase [Amycolatopsis sp. H20-H5]MEC3977099.1 GNAT family N-acetyltransferase [Amycolatopsis sp. H20-H5]